MSKKTNKSKHNASIITIGGNRPMPGQSRPNTIVITQPRRFGIDIGDYVSAVTAAENVDYVNRSKLYDLYEDILMDSHLSCVIEKRRNAVLSSDVEFRRNGKPDPVVNEQIRSPWFDRLISDILDAKFHGFSLMQVFKHQTQWLDYTLIPRKHVDPERRLILRRQTDLSGESWDQYDKMLFVGKPRDLGLLAKAAPWVIYKRGSVGDWSQFAEVFGMPIQEYTYDSDDDTSRQRAVEDAKNAGGMAVFIHGKDTDLNLLEAGNKTGSADVYERLCERANNELSKLMLTNTLTTEASSTGTQALGSVHKKGEDLVILADQKYILNVLNYDMTDIFEELGIHTAGGEFCYPEKKSIDPTTKVNIITQLRTGFNLPIDDDYLYREFGIEKPADYDAIKKRQEADREARKQARAAAMIPDDDGDNDDDDPPVDGKAQPVRQPRPHNRNNSVYGAAPADHRSIGMILTRLYCNAGTGAENRPFSQEVLQRALRNIYSADFDPETEIEPHLFNEIRRIFDEAVTDGIGESDDADPENDFAGALRHSAEVFTAFKVHAAQREMARMMLDSNGDLKSFEQWSKDVQPIASHQCGSWLRTEYDTAVLRARQAADWQQFDREKEILPNLRWEPSTSPHPGEDHRRFWGVTRPVDDPFWSAHRPGDRWNCKCSLSATDEPETDLPAEPDSITDRPQSGLRSNPGTTGQLFSNDHPYLPASCSECPFAGRGFRNRLLSVFTNRTKDCYSCRYIDKHIARIGKL